MSDNDNDRLVKIPATCWNELRDLYQFDHHIAFHIVNNYIIWYQKDQNIKDLEILSLNGEWKSDGTFLIVVSI